MTGRRIPARRDLYLGGRTCAPTLDDWAEFEALASALEPVRPALRHNGERMLERELVFGPDIRCGLVFAQVHE